MTTTTPAASAPSRVVAAVAVVGAVVLLVGVALSARGVATEDLGTVLSAASEGTVLVVGDVARPARRGTDVPDGATVRTPAGGTAALSTGGRVVQLAPLTAVLVQDGARQTLTTGSALVEASEGPGLQLATDGGTRVDVRDDAVVRVEQASPVRVATYRGAAEVGVERRRARTTVGRLFQVEVQGSALPSRPTPLRLLPGDGWERSELEAVVDTDTELRRAVTGYQQQGGVVVAALLDRDPSAATQGAVARAEQALAFALAHDGAAFDDDVFQLLLRDRADGGSWGVVADLHGVSADALDAFTQSLVPGQDGTSTVPLQAAGAPAQDVLGELVGLSAGDGETAPAAAASDRPAPAGGVGPTSRPSPSAGPSRRPGLLPAPVRDLVDTVLDILPVQPPPAAPAAPAAVAPGPVASAVPSAPAPLLQLELEVPVLR